ncbi:MAG: FAD/NAD(P)-binding oxidoreductase [Solirubrobacterales bacterium]
MTSASAYGDRPGVLVVGASLAGLHAAEALRETGYQGGLTILGAERSTPYDRPPLSKELLLGEKSSEDVRLAVSERIEADWILGQRAVALDTVEKLVRTDQGAELRYGALIVATGSEPRRRPGLEPDGERVLELRTLDDAVRLRRVLREADRILVVGGGFIGIEVASTARALGVGVTVVTLDPPLVAAGHLAAGACRAMLREHSVGLHEGRTVASLRRDERGVVAVLDEGTEVEASAAVVAVGATPNVAWLRGSGLRLEDGVLCDAELRALGVEDVYAAGDVARWPNPLFAGRSMRVEHWTNAVEQGRAVAVALTQGRQAQPFASLPSVWSDHFGTRLQTAGLTATADEFEIEQGSVEEGEFAAIARLEGRPVGALAYGMRRDFALLRGRLHSQLQVGEAIG